ncbi:MAG: VOC family protein [Tissierellaceae bacterium]|nr:VOC family protein [Tissierellaceae bacterium]
MTKFHNKPNLFVNEIVLKVTDIDRSIDFYTKIMGFSILKKNGKDATLTADGFNPILTLIEPEDVIPKVPKRTGLYHFAVLLPSRYDLGLFLKNIRDEWYPIIGGADHGVSEAIYLEDPDDNGIEVYRDVAESEWDRSGDRINMVTEPLNYDELIAESGEDKWDKTPLDTIIGHIHLHVGDLDKARRFYCDGLGFDLTMEAGSSAIFLSTGGYHHHIGLNVWNGRNADPLPDNSVGMKYYTLQFPDKRSREEIINNLENLGYEVIKDDKDTFTKDPSSNLIKLKV